MGVLNLAAKCSGYLPRMYIMGNKISCKTKLAASC